MSPYTSIKVRKLIAQTNKFRNFQLGRGLATSREFHISIRAEPVYE